MDMNGGWREEKMVGRGNEVAGGGRKGVAGCD
jgi:hypothetical protein